MFFAFTLAERDGRADVYNMLASIRPAELTMWQAYYELIDESKSSMESPDAFEGRIAKDYKAP